EAAAELWRSRRTNAGARGQTTLWIDGRPLVALWRGAPERRTAMVIAPGALLGLAAAGETARSAIFDGEGRLVAGQRGAAGKSVVRAAAENELPWTLAVAAPPLTRAPGLLPGQRFLLLGTGVMALFLVAGTYFIARAIR